MNDRAHAILTELMGRPLVDDPFPLYGELREIAPVHCEPNGLWYLTRFADCERVLRSSNFGHGGEAHHAGAHGRRQQLLSLMFSYDDPPEHTRKRGLVTAPFSAAAMARYRPRVHELVDELLGPIGRGDEIDLDAQLSARLPVLVTCELLGIPAADRERCVGWIELLTSSNQPVLTGPESARILQDADRAANDAAEYFLWLIRERAAAPCGDILSELAPLALEDGQYSPDEIAATLLLLMAAGFETTRYTITGGLGELAQAPAQWAAAQRQIAENGIIGANAFEELLRHQGPIHGALARRAHEADVIGGVEIPAGAAVVAMLAAANRDPAVYDDPEELDIERTERRPLSFGAGPHYCLGASLARDEIILAVSGVVARFEGLDVLAPPDVKGSFNVRGPKGLVVRTR